MTKDIKFTIIIMPVGAPLALAWTSDVTLRGSWITPETGRPDGVYFQLWPTFTSHSGRALNCHPPKMFPTFFRRNVLNRFRRKKNPFWKSTTTVVCTGKKCGLAISAEFGDKQSYGIVPCGLERIWYTERVGDPRDHGNGLSLAAPFPAPPI